MRYLRLMLGLWLAVAVFSAGFISEHASAQRPDGVEEELRLTLERYILARNSFNTDAFLDFFVRSPELTVVTATTEHIGWNSLRRGIAPLFEARASTIEVSDIRVFPVSRDLGIVHHHYQLKTSRGTGSPSRATKVFYRTPEGWKVVAEHSSRIPDFVRR